MKLATPLPSVQELEQWAHYLWRMDLIQGKQYGVLMMIIRRYGEEG